MLRLILLLITFISINASEKKIVVIIPSYNNVEFFLNNIDSVIQQKYKNYRVLYIDDSSTDGSFDAVCEHLDSKNISFEKIIFSEDEDLSIDENTSKFIALVNSSKKKIRVIKNLKRAGALANIYRGCMSTSDEEIIAMVDGDDSLHHKFVLKLVEHEYKKSKNVWMTHGRLIEIPSGHSNWCIPVPKEIIEKNEFRKYRCPTHLKTFYSWLFKKIKLEDLTHESKFFPMTSDMAIMFPMLEMSGDRHVFISKINYRYNTINFINDNKIDPEKQRFYDNYIRNLSVYERLHEDQIPEFMR